MEIKPIFNTLMKNKIFSILIILQIAITMTVLSTAIIISADALRDWNQFSGLQEENIILVKPQSFNSNINIAQMLGNDLYNIKNINGVINASPVRSIPIEGRKITTISIGTGDKKHTYQSVIFDFDEHGFDVLDRTLIAGRFFNASEVIRGNINNVKSKPSVVLISESLSKTLFPQGDAINKTLWLSDDSEAVEIIGIYNNFLNGEILNDEGREYHNIIRPQTTWQIGNDPNYLIRVEAGRANDLIERINNKLYETRDRYIHTIETLIWPKKRMYDGRGSRALIRLASSFILLIITALGMAGMVSFLVTRRKKQIGIRRALGATKWAVVRYFIVENSLLTCAGLLIGVILVFILVIISDGNLPVFNNLLYLFATALFIWVINVFAAWVPAKRAADVAPAIVTRSA